MFDYDVNTINDIETKYINKSTIELPILLFIVSIDFKPTLTCQSRLNKAIGSVKLNRRVGIVTSPVVLCTAYIYIYVCV